MPLIAVGLSHRTAPLELRERVVFDPQRLPEALRELAALPGVEEGAILSTCNRTEVYCAVNGTESAAVSEWLAQHHRLSSADLDAFLYIHQDDAAVRHIFRVASGLDSMILGEPQILGQMKDAYQDATAAGTLHQRLSKLFQYTFSVAKQIRTDTAIGVSAVSVAFAAVSLARQIFGDLEDQTALLVGAGETIELTARHLHEQKLGRMIVANRTVQRAHALATQFDGYAIALADMPAHLHEADIIISSTASQLPILGKGAVERALKVRKHRPMFMVDIAVPRDIEPEVDGLDDVYLYTVDDLKEVVQENLKSRQEAARQAEEIVEAQTAHFMGWMRSLVAVSTIRHFREGAEGMRDEVLEKARQQIAQGKDPGEVLEYLAHILTNKLIHHPSVQLRQAGYEGRTDLLEAARELLCPKHGE
ncbi:MAG: glutamyl-tRNA reductase [Gammaproteobacteria bacterium]